MRPRSLIVLTLLVVGLGAFVWLGRELPSSEESAQRAKQVLQVEPEAVHGLEIEWEDHSVALSRQTDGETGGGAMAGAAADWLITRPVEARADGTAIDGLVRRLVAMEKERTLEDVERAAVGLSEPRARVRVATDEGEHVLEVGAEVPASSSMTLAIEGETPVYVVSSSIWSDLTKDASDWRDKNLFSGQRSDIERIVLEHEGERTVLAKRGSDFWVESPLADRADQTQVNALLSTITGLRAERFIEPGAADSSVFGLDSGAEVIEVVLAGREAPMRLVLGSKEEPGEPAVGDEVEAPIAEAAVSSSMYLEADGQIVTTTAQLSEHTLRPLSEWRSKDLVSGEVYELARVGIEDAAGSTELLRVDSDWLRDGEKIDFGAATDLLYEISGGTAQRAVDPESVGDLGEPILTFELVPEAVAGDTVGSPEVLQLYRPVGDETPARVSGRDVLLMLSAETVTGLREKLVALRLAAVEDGADSAGLEEGDPPDTATSSSGDSAAMGPGGA